MMMKPPVIFTLYEPSEVISGEEADSIIRGAFSDSDAFRRLWLHYARTVLSDAEPCMEANDGANATVRALSRKLFSSALYICEVGEGTFRLELDGHRLFLRETKEGDVLLYFLTTLACLGRGSDEFLLDLSDYSSEAAAAFITTVFSSCGRVEAYLRDRMRA